MKKKIKKILSQGFDDFEDGKSYYERTVPRIEKLLHDFSEELIRKEWWKGYKSALKDCVDITGCEECKNELKIIKQK